MTAPDDGGSVSSGTLRMIFGSDYSTQSGASDHANESAVPVPPRTEVTTPQRYRYSPTALRELRHERCSTLPENITKPADVPQRKIATLKPNPPTPFAALALPTKLLNSLSSLSLITATPIQATAIPYARLGGDLVAQATSGTGKTLTYALVALNTILPATPSKGALIIVPARELANQVSDVFTELSTVRVVTLVGGRSESVDEENLSKHANVVVGTPGRVEAMVTRGSLDVASIKILVLDEADRLLDGSFGGSVERICRMLPTRQTLAFSATFSYSFRMSLLEIMREPAWIGGSQVVHSVVQRKATCSDLNDKINSLKIFLRLVKFNLCVVFFNAKKAAGRVVRNLTTSFPFQTKKIHAGMTQKERDAVIRDVRQGSVRVLVTTDVLARGIDFDSCDFVVHMDVPLRAETYLHRVGRAGRFGRKGSSLLMFGEGEVSSVLALEDDLGYVIENKIVLDDERRFKALESSSEDTTDRTQPLQKEGISVLNHEEEKNDERKGHNPNSVSGKNNDDTRPKEARSSPSIRTSRKVQVERENSNMDLGCKEAQSPSGAVGDAENEGQKQSVSVRCSTGVKQEVSLDAREQSGIPLNLTTPVHLHESFQLVGQSKKEQPVPDLSKRPRFPDDPATPAKKRKSARLLVQSIPVHETARAEGTHRDNFAQSGNDTLEVDSNTAKKRQRTRLDSDKSALQQHADGEVLDGNKAIRNSSPDGNTTRIGARRADVRENGTHFDKDVTQLRVHSSKHAHRRRGTGAEAGQGIVPPKERDEDNGVITAATWAASRDQVEAGSSDNIPYGGHRSDENCISLIAEEGPAAPTLAISQECREAWDRYAQDAYDTGYREAYEEAFQIARELHQRLEGSAG